MAGFSITDVLMPSSISSAPRQTHEIERISYYDLVPSEDNFYSMRELDELKSAIELAGRVLDNLVVTPLPDGRYKILSGHRRHRAVGLLLDEGKEEYEFLPCAVEQITDEERSLREQVLLIAANSQREKTAWDKLEEVRRMRDLQRQAKAQTGAGGRVRDRVAQSLHISSARVAKYDSILNNLTPALMDEIKADRLPVSAAYELSRLPEEEQLAAYTGLHEDKPAKAQKPRRQTAQPEPDDVFQSNTQTSPAGNADHLVQTICRLCSSDHAVLQQLAELLRYEPEQLACDIKALAARH